MFQLQDQFSVLPQTLRAIEDTLSVPRFARYVRVCGGDRHAALRLYVWNSMAGRSLQWPLEMLEVSVRNGICRVLCHRYGPRWHLQTCFLSQLGDRDRATLHRLTTGLPTLPWPPADAVVPDLSFGFWTRLLTRRHDVPLGWTSRLRIAFPHLPENVHRARVAIMLDDARNLRNRISHHEPLVGLKLPGKHRDILQVIGWVCPDTRWLVERHDRFPDVWDAHPLPRFRMDDGV